MNYYLTLPNKLKEKGYSVNSYHGYEASFWNREVMHRTLGFDKFFSLDDFDNSEQVGWAVSDRSFFRQSLDFSIEESQGMPFYSMMIALSSHHPYDAFYSGPYTSENNTGMVRRYFNGARYVDSAIEEFFEYLKEKGLYEDTIVVIYGDHAGLFHDDAKDTLEFFGKEFSHFEWQKYEKIPLIIHNPDLKALYTDKVCGQIDLLPTIANIMGLEFEYLMGNDILNSNYEGEIVRRQSNVITNEYIYIALEDKVYDKKTGQELELEHYREKINEFYKQLRAIDLIYRSDYLRVYNKEK